MKGLLFTVLVIFVLRASFAHECAYEEYFKLVHKAKQEYKTQNFKEANRGFKQAFSKVDFPLGHDLSFALIAADNSKDDLWAGEIAKVLAKGGIPLRYFSQYKKRKWYAEFYSEYDKYVDYFNKNFSLEYRIRVNDLLKKDRKNTDRYHKWRTGEIELTLEELFEGPTEILCEFENLVNEFGFPSERLMGYNYIRRLDKIEPFSPMALLVHIYQRGVLIFKDEIQKIVCDGGLHPSNKKTLNKIRGFGNSSGIEQEMRVRYKMYRDSDAYKN